MNASFAIVDTDTVNNWDRDRRQEYHDRFDARIRQALERIGYKPGSSFELCHGCLEVRTVEYDLDDGERTEMPWVVDEFRDRVADWAAAAPEVDFDTAVLVAVRSVIHEEEAHEADEWLRLDDERVFDPHDSAAALVAFVETHAWHTRLAAAHAELAAAQARIRELETALAATTRTAL